MSKNCSSNYNYVELRRMYLADSSTRTYFEVCDTFAGQTYDVLRRGRAVSVVVDKKRPKTRVRRVSFYTLLPQQTWDFGARARAGTANPLSHLAFAASCTVLGTDRRRRETARDCDGNGQIENQRHSPSSAADARRGGRRPRQRLLPWPSS